MVFFFAVFVLNLSLSGMDGVWRKWTSLTERSGGGGNAYSMNGMGKRIRLDNVCVFFEKKNCSKLADERYIGVDLLHFEHLRIFHQIDRFVVNFGGIYAKWCVCVN